MRLRLGLAVGAAVGYVLGAKAGQSRYEELKNAAERVADNPVVKSASAVVQGQAEKAEHLVADRIRNVSGPAAATTESDVLLTTDPEATR